MTNDWKFLKFRSGKWSHYFDIYEREIGSQAESGFTLIEVGVKEGGSLEYWKSKFPQARVIGVDLNPKCKTIDPSFEIYIGDQADPRFWDEFFGSVGPFQVLIDDGGHSYHQQIQTVESALKFIEEGVIIVEDTHSSFLSDFHPDSSYTFIEYASSISKLLTLKSFADDPDRFSFIPNQQSLHLYQNVLSVNFYQNIVAFQISKSQASTFGVQILNSGIDSGIDDFRYNGLKSSLVPHFDRYFNITLIETPLEEIKPSIIPDYFRKLRQVILFVIRKLRG